MIDISEAMTAENIKDFIYEVDPQIEDIYIEFLMENLLNSLESIELLHYIFSNAQISDPEADDAKVIKFLAGKSIEFNRHKASADKLQEYQTILKLNVEEFELQQDDLFCILPLQV